MKDAREQREEAMQDIQAYLDMEEKDMLPPMDDPSGFLQSTLNGIESAQRWLGLTPGWTGKEEEGEA